MTDAVRLKDVAPSAEWKGASGQAWAQYRDRIERASADATAALLDHAAPRPGEAVLDVGCGTGPMTRRIAERVGRDGVVVGVDISAPMLEIARAENRHANTKFVEADAATFAFSPLFDLLISRFGVMFFADPVPAFRNLAGAMGAKGRLGFICFRGLAENEFAKVPLAAAKPLFPDRPPPDPHAPGSFAFADPDRVRTMLENAGFRDVEIKPFDGVMHLGALDDAAFLTTFVIGPMSRALENADESLRRRAFEAIKSALAHHVADEGVTLGMACWLVGAQGRATKSVTGTGNGNMVFGRNSFEVRA